jgi:hypothetical protein
LGDGEGGGYGDEEKEERDIIGRRFVIMKSLMAVLMGVAVLLVICSCATITERSEERTLSLGIQESSRGGELRLSSMDVALSGNVSANVEYWATINFEANPESEIRRACFNFSGGGQSCIDVQAKDVTYRSHPYFRVPIHVPMGTKRIDCHAEYIRDGKTRRTNTVTYYVIILKKPEE